ncbi:hypothetical protein C8J57DRAFT_1337541, partial [Mycena rebaudengoi]
VHIYIIIHSFYYILTYSFHVSLSFPSPSHTFLLFSFAYIHPSAHLHTLLRIRFIPLTHIIGIFFFSFH